MVNHHLSTNQHQSWRIFPLGNGINHLSNMISHDIPLYLSFIMDFLQDFRMTPVPRGTSCSCAKVAKPLRRLRWWDCHSDGRWGYSWCIYYILYTIYIHTIYIHYIYIHYIYIHYIYIHYIYRYTIYELPPKLYCPKMEYLCFLRYERRPTETVTGKAWKRQGRTGKRPNHNSMIHHSWRSLLKWKSIKKLLLQGLPQLEKVAFVFAGFDLFFHANTLSLTLTFLVVKLLDDWKLIYH